MATAREPMVKRVYAFTGAVKVYDKLAADVFKAETFASSPGKAKNNIAYQFRRKANIADHVPVTLIGEIVPR